MVDWLGQVKWTGMRLGIRTERKEVLARGLRVSNKKGCVRAFVWWQCNCLFEPNWFHALYYRLVLSDRCDLVGGAGGGCGNKLNLCWHCWNKYSVQQETTNFWLNYLSANEIDAKNKHKTIKIVEENYVFMYFPLKHMILKERFPCIH